MGTRGSIDPAGARIPGPGARLAAFSLYDFADSGFATTVVTVLFSQYYATVVAGGQAGVRILGARIPGATLFAWLVALSMALVAVVSPVLGALADRRGSRIRSLAVFWAPGVALTLALATVGPGEWLQGGLLFAAGYACFAACSVFYNALLPEVAPPERLGRASGIAWGVGYLGGAALLVLNLLMLERPRALGFAPGSFTIQDCFASAGWWWLVFTLPLLWVFRYEARRAAAAPPASGPAARPALASDIRAAFAQVRHTIGAVARTRNLARFFLAYLLYNDGVQTIVTMASIFGAQELGMKPAALILYFLLIQATAFGGAIVLGYAADRLGHKEVLLTSIAAWIFFTVWAFALGIFGSALREYWVLGGLAGLFLGGIQSCSRSLTAQWIPAGRESEFFGFFSVMGRVASIFGPLVYGALVLATGSLRGAILSVTAFFVAGGILLAVVRPREIEAERAALAED